MQKYKEIKRRNSVVSKENSSLKLKIEELKVKNESKSSEKLNVLEDENKALKIEVVSLNEILAKFTQGKESLDKLLKNQRSVLNRTGLGYKPETKQKVYADYFKKSSQQQNPANVCHYCNKKGHHFNICWYNKNVYNGIKMMWVPKGTKTPKAVNDKITTKSKTNVYGPKVVWVPK